VIQIELLIVAVVLSFVGFGCHHPTGSRAQSLSMGMPLTQSKAVLQQHNIRLILEDGAYGSPHLRPSHRYVIETSASPDAVFVVWEQGTVGNEYYLEEMYLYKNWQKEKSLGVGDRTDDEIRLLELPIVQLQHWIENGKWPSNLPDHR
jgi:hypothetical protein